MAAIPCNLTTLDELHPYLSWPTDLLEEFVAKCPRACLLIYGSGDADLAGVGVRKPPR